MTQYNAEARVVDYLRGQPRDELEMARWPVAAYVIEVTSPASEAGRKLQINLPAGDNPLDPDLKIGEIIKINL
jgi:hypothetical protein